MKENTKEIGKNMPDTLTERPYGFMVGDSHFYIYPVTLGKMYRLQSLLELLCVDQKNLQTNLALEALRLAREKKDICLTIICYHTFKTKDEMDDTDLLLKRKALFGKELSEEDIASLMIILLDWDKTDMLIHHFGIDKEQERLNAVMKVKSSKNNLVFGGKSIYGSFIGQLLEKGFSWDEILWERSYTNLRMVLADKISSIFVSDDELKKIPVNVKNANEEIIKPTKENMQRIMNMDWK